MNTGWREAILQEFPAGIHPVTLVADPDDLFVDERLLAELQARGFALEVYEDPIAFRYLYESTYRPPPAAAAVPELIVLVRAERDALGNLPYDLLQRGRQLDFSLAGLFPNLSRNVVALLDKRDLDALAGAQPAAKPAPLGENATKDYILRHVYGVPADSFKGDAEILGKLLHVYVSGRQLPPALAERLVAQINSATGFGDWPLFELLTDATALLAFLQERWPIFLDQLAAETEGATSAATVREAIAANQYMLRWPGQALLPFTDPHIRAYVDTLFIEGKLRPVAHAKAAELRDQWVAVGLQEETAEDRRQKLLRLIENLHERVPAAEALYQDWIDFARSWAELAVQSRHRDAGAEPIAPLVDSLQGRVDVAFQEWLGRRYHNLATLPPHPPVMVHHTARSLARDIRTDSKAKIALVVLDGMAWDQWLVARAGLLDQLPALQFSEGAVFAWIPTITSVSRQAIFAGKSPAGFPNTISTTTAESALWSAFWEDQGLDKGAVGYEKGLRDHADLARVDTLVSQARMRVVGLVVNQIDEMMHGEKLGTEGFHDSIRLWIDKGFMAELLSLLAESDYQIVLTADHGNIEARGAGSLYEQSLANSRGTRARIYPNEGLRSKVHMTVPDTVPWPTTGLPPDYWPLLAPSRTAFATAGVPLVTHGGSALEEVVVPYIRVHWSEAT